jgi:hypothetical protein
LQGPGALVSTKKYMDNVARTTSPAGGPLLKPMRFLVGQGFVIRQVSDSTDFSSDPQAAPGTWEHFTAIAPPWLTFRTTHCPEWAE